MLIKTDLSMMDLTGSNEAFKRIAIPFRIYKTSQVISLGEPAYTDSVVVEIMSGDTLVSYTSFTKGVADETAIARAKYAGTQVTPTPVEFTATLINSLTVTGYTSSEFTVYVTYQALYHDTVNMVDDIVGPSYSPGLMSSVLNQLSYLNNILPPIPDITSDDINSIQVLAEDITGESNDNYIQDEIHLQVNTLANRFVVRPANGSFYKKDLVVKLNDVTLVENVGYKVVGINLGKTRVTTSNDSVYDYIVILAEVASGAAVSITYRAFGGMVCPAAMNQTRTLLKNIIEYIKLGNFITVDTLKDHPLIIYILDRLNLIENMLNISAPITYLYSSSAVDSWVNIAHVAPDGITGLVDSKGVGHFRVRTEKYFAEIKLNYDLTSTGKVLSSHTVSSWATTIDQDKISHISTRVCPKFRILWNSDSVNSGLVLQMSVTRSVAKDIYVEIQNYGGAFSTWTMLPSTGVVLTPVTTTTTLPDDSVWNSAESTSLQSNVVVASGKGYAIFVGNIPTHLLDPHTYTYDITGDPEDNTTPIMTKHTGLPVASLITGSDVLIGEVDALVFKVYDRYAGTMISKVSDNLSIAGETVKASAMYFDQDMCSVEGTLTKTEGGYNLWVGATTGTHSVVNERFDLRQIDILFKGAINHA